MKRWMMILAVCAALGLAGGTAWAGSPHGHATPPQASVQLAHHGHNGPHANWNRGHHAPLRPAWGAYYRPRPYVAPPYYPVYPYPAVPYGYSGITVVGPRVGVSIGF